MQKNKCGSFDVYRLSANIVDDSNTLASHQSGRAFGRTVSSSSLTPHCRAKQQFTAREFGSVVETLATLSYRVGIAEQGRSAGRADGSFTTCYGSGAISTPWLHVRIVLFCRRKAPSLNASPRAVGLLLGVGRCVWRRSTGRAARTKSGLPSLKFSS